MTDDGFAQGLVNRRQALLEKKKVETPMPTIDENPFGDGLPEGEEDLTEEQEQEETPPELPAAAKAPEPAAGVTRLGKKIGRPRGKKNKPVEAAAAPPVQVATPNEPEEDVTKVGDGISPRDPTVLWPKIIEKARAAGVNPELIQISIERSAIGPAPTAFVLIDTIGGDVVAGDESGNAGQMLVDYVTEVIHLTRKAPAQYKLHARYRVRQIGSFATMYLKLDHPDEIRALRMRKADFLATQRVSSGSAPNWRSPPAMPGMGHWPSQTPTLPAPAPPAQTTPPSPMDQLDQWRRWEEFRQQLVQTGQPAPPSMPMPTFQPPPAPPPPPQLPPPAPAMSKEQEELIFEARMNRFIKANGYVLPSEAPAAKPAEIKDRAAGFKDIIAAFKELETFKTQITEAVGGGNAGAEEEEEPAAPNPIDKVTLFPIPAPGGKIIQLPRNTKGTVDFIQQWLGSNPEMTMELGVRAMGGIAQALDQTSFGKVLAGLAARGGPPAQIAQAVAAAGIQGSGPLNGTATPTRIRSPQA